MRHVWLAALPLCLFASFGFAQTSNSALAKLYGPGRGPDFPNSVAGNSFPDDAVLVGDKIVFLERLSVAYFELPSRLSIDAMPLAGGPITKLITADARIDVAQPAGSKLSLGAPIAWGSNIVFYASFLDASGKAIEALYQLPSSGGTPIRIVGPGDSTLGTLKAASILDYRAISSDEFVVDLPSAPGISSASPIVRQYRKLTSSGVELRSSTYSREACFGQDVSSIWTVRNIVSGDGVYATTWPSGVGFKFVDGSYSTYTIVASSNEQLYGCDQVVFDPSPNGIVMPLPGAPAYFIPDTSVFPIQRKLSIPVISPNLGIHNGKIYFYAQQEYLGELYGGIFEADPATHSVRNILSQGDISLPGPTSMPTNCSLPPVVSTSRIVSSPSFIGGEMIVSISKSVSSCTAGIKTEDRGGLYAYNLDTKNLRLLLPTKPNDPTDLDTRTSSLNPALGQLPLGRSRIPQTSIQGNHFLYKVIVGVAIDPSNGLQVRSIPVNDLYLFTDLKNQVATTTSLTASATNVTAGSIVTLQAHVSSLTEGSPIGAITFKNGNTSLGSAALVNGSASLQFIPPDPALLAITAVYSGDANFLGSTSPLIKPSVGTSTVSCSAPATPNKNLICSPANGSNTDSGLFYLSATSNVTRFAHNRVYLDDVAVYDTDTAQSIRTSLNAARGSHHLVLVSWNSDGTAFTSSSDFTVGATTPTGCIPSAVGVSICSPVSGTYPSQVSVTSGARTSSGSITAMRVYIDDAVAYTSFNSASSATYQFTQNISVGPGTHRLVMVAYQSDGSAQTSSVNFTTAAETCSPDATMNSLRICLPSASSAVSSPALVSAGAHTNSGYIAAMRIYIDDNPVATVNNGANSQTQILQLPVSIPSGTHNMVIIGYISTGGYVSAQQQVTAP